MNENLEKSNLNEFEAEKKKQVIGLYGEMQLAMRLHSLGWQVHRSYIDEGIDFVVSRYYCKKCAKFSSQLIRKSKFEGKMAKCVTNLCESCKEMPLEIVTRYLQVKTSEGVEVSERGESLKDVRLFSFHPKIRYKLGRDVFYVWIAVFEGEKLENSNLHFYIFSTNDVERFDDMTLPTYQITDNQKTTLKIDKSGKVLTKGKKYSYGHL